MNDDKLELLKRIKEKFKSIRPAVVWNHGLIYQHKRIINPKPLSYEHKYNICKINLGIGNEPKFLITKTYDILPTGEIPIFANYLPEFNSDIPEPLEDGQKVLTKILNLHNIVLQGGVVVTAWELLQEKNKEEHVFFIKSLPFAIDEFRDFISSFTNKDFEDLFDFYLMGDGFKTDERIEYTYRIGLLPFTFGSVEPEIVMKFNPHGIIIINTKTRKTTIGHILGDVLDRASSARFLGFSTANDIVVGYGNGKWRPIYFDEIDSSNKIFIDNVFNYMELGSTTVSVGRENIVTRGWSTLTFHSNPKTETNEPIYLFLAFNEFLDYFSEKVDGLGSRVAVILFGNDFGTYRRIVNITNEDKNLIKAFTDSVVEMITPSVEKLILDEKVQQWLYKEIPDYKETIIAILNSNQNLPNKIKRLWKSQTESYTHMRGFALKQAVYENIADILGNRVNIDSLLEKAEEHLDKLKRINVESLEKMCIMKPHQQLLEISYKNLPEYCRGLIIACYITLKDAEVRNGPLLLSVLSNKYNEFAQKLPSKFKLSQAYCSFSRIESNLRQLSIEKINKKLEAFEMKLAEKDNDLLIVPNPTWEKILSLKFLEPMNYIEDIKVLYKNRSEIPKNELEAVIPADIIRKFLSVRILEQVGENLKFTGVTTFTDLLLSEV
jgi:hypothetical protein